MFPMKKLAVLLLLYFAQGFPYGLQSKHLPILLRASGESIHTITNMKWLLLPWMLKVFWAPFVEGRSTFRLWLLWTMFLLIVMTALATTTTSAVGVAAALLVINFLTSLQDVATDGIAMIMLSSDQLGAGNSVQVVGYKLGAVVGGGLFYSLTGDHLNNVFLLMAGLYLIIFVATYLLINDTQRRSDCTRTNIHVKKVDEGGDTAENNVREKTSAIYCYKTAFREVLSTPGTARVLMFVCIYKLGEQGSLSLYPMFLIDRHVHHSDVVFWSGVVGQGASVVGSLLAGVLLSINRLKLVTFVQWSCSVRVLCHVTQLLVLLDPALPGSTHSLHASGYISLFSVVLMSLTGGLLSTACFTVMMSCSKTADRHPSTHYTMLATCEVGAKLTFSALTATFLTLFGSYLAVFCFFTSLSVICLPVVSVLPRYNRLKKSI